MSWCVAVVSDRGLAGGFNSNVLRTVEKTIRAKKAQGVEVERYRLWQEGRWLLQIPRRDAGS